MKQRPVEIEVDSCLSRANYLNGSNRMQSRSRTTIFPNRNLTGGSCAHSSHSNCAEIGAVTDGSRPRAAIQSTRKSMSRQAEKG